jgi:hypothetical protein
MKKILFADEAKAKKVAIRMNPRNIRLEDCRTRGTSYYAWLFDEDATCICFAHGEGKDGSRFQVYFLVDGSAHKVGRDASDLAFYDESVFVKKTNAHNNNKRIMEKKKYTWNTEFQTADHTMIHVFSDRVGVVTDLRFRFVKILRDGEILDQFSIADENEMSVKEYENFLVKIAESAEQLEELENRLMEAEREAVND